MYAITSSNLDSALPTMECMIERHAAAKREYDRIWYSNF